MSARRGKRQPSLLRLLIETHRSSPRAFAAKRHTVTEKLSAVVNRILANIIQVDLSFGRGHSRHPKKVVAGFEREIGRHIPAGKEREIADESRAELTG